MEPEESMTEPPHRGEMPRGCYTFNLVLNVLIAFILGVGIVLILDAFNRSGWFALLSGLFGTLLYSALVFPRLLFGRRPALPRARHRAAGEAGQEQVAQRATRAAAYRGILLFGLLGIADGVGLFFLPDQRPVFALISAVLGILLCMCLFAIGISVLVLFLAHRERIGPIEVRVAPPVDVRGNAVDENPQ
jgi:hypothetical protein